MAPQHVLPPAYAGLVDDAAIFPPGNAALDAAVREHLEDRRSPYAGLVGAFVVSDLRLPELIEVLGTLPEEARPGPLPVTVVVGGGAGALEPAARWADGSDLLELRSLEVALRDLDDLAGNARRVAAAADLGLDVEVYVEPPLVGLDLALGELPAGWLAALDAVAEADLRAKLRTGGVTADLVPPVPLLAAALDAALDRELPFKCTAGLHHAVRHHDDAGHPWHGFLNVLLGTRTALDGGDVAGALAESDPAVVLARLAEVGEDALGRTRRWFASFGCCGVHDPLEDLVELGLLDLGASA